ncbi:hypothetical protein P7H17_17365 [Paenibacillus larvae]|nr:hypothetical protein [Paenibacillus larvae]MDT2262111.1 hypothetical protein [Paenibacillus larvae]MDT2276982.1 hypothetical protein [Paenibacillus larvae]MDT2287468.1 hypothetical protein [Paenibacillus larvae]
MKKFLSMVMIISLMGVLAACGDKSTEASKKNRLQQGHHQKIRKISGHTMKTQSGLMILKGLKLK